MTLQRGQHNILATSLTIDKIKKRTLTTSQGREKDVYDQTVLVFHKKKWQERSLKDLGSGMVLCVKREQGGVYVGTEDGNAFLLARSLYPSFDEKIGKVSYFFPTIGNMSTSFLDLLEKTYKDDVYKNELRTTSFNVSFFYGLSRLYGNWRTTKGMLQTISFHIPSVGSYNAVEIVTSHINDMQLEGILIHSSENLDGLSVSLYDPFLLDIFSKWSMVADQSVIRDNWNWMRSQLFEQVEESKSLETGIENAMFVTVK